MSLNHVQKVRILYKTILRIHRGLPKALQELGTNYVKDEFKRHKNCSGKEAAIFLHEWTGYAINMANQVGVRGNPPKAIEEIGSQMDEEMLENFRSEQIVQLYELMVAAKDLDDNEENVKS